MRHKHFLPDLETIGELGRSIYQQRDMEIDMAFARKVQGDCISS